jgi:hypothetical protein
METAKSQYAYFQSLDKTVKIGLAIYLVMFFGGIVLTVAGLRDFLDSLEHFQIVVILGLTVFVGLGLFGLLYGISKIHWLGEIHIWLDKNFFGFLKKSNEIIFRELVYALEPEERASAVNIESHEKGTVAQSIFSRLSDDDQLFERILASGIFRYWIWYWIMIYGTFVFMLLSLLSFGAALIGSDAYGTTLFTTNWSLALVHLLMTLSLGYQLMRMTRQTVDDIVSSYRGVIAAILRATINRYRTAF